MKEKGHLLPELPRINTAEDIVDIDGLTFSMLEFNDIYDSKEYKELSTRTESAVKQLIEKDREHRKTNFTYLLDLM